MSSRSRIDELLAQLPESVLEYGGSHAGKVYQSCSTLNGYRSGNDKRVNFLVMAIPPQIPCGTLLDVGCSNGSITAILHAAFFSETCGWDINPIEIEIARALYGDWNYGYGPPKYEVHDIALDTPNRRYDVILYLSVWKWVVRRHGLEAANQTIVKLANHCPVLMFESGITDSGIDLGVGVTRADFHTLLPALLPNCKVELVGQFPRDEQNVDRDLWRITWP